MFKLDQLILNQKQQNIDRVIAKVNSSIDLKHEAGEKTLAVIKISE